MEDDRAHHAQAMVVRRMDTIDNLAMSAFKGLTIINGGAVVALFALLAQGSDSSFVAKLDFRFAIFSATAFASGLLFVLAANVLGYFGQQELHWWEQEVLEERLQLLEGQEDVWQPDGRKVARGNRLIRAGGWCAGLSLFGFFSGCAFMIASSLAAL